MSNRFPKCSCDDVWQLKLSRRKQTEFILKKRSNLNIVCCLPLHLSSKNVYLFPLKMRLVSGLDDSQEFWEVCPNCNCVKFLPKQENIEHSPKFNLHSMDHGRLDLTDDKNPANYSIPTRTQYLNHENESDGNKHNHSDFSVTSALSSDVNVLLVPKKFEVLYKFLHIIF